MAWKGEHGSAGEQFALALIGLFPIVAMVAAVLVQSKYVAALAQLGSLFERERVYDEHQSAVSGGESDTAAPETRFRASTVIRDRAESTAKRAVKAADKLYFVLGVLNVALTAYLVGAAPQYFHLWHTPKALFLVSLRWWTFMKEGKHWLLADFCYWANLIGLVFLWVFPSNALLFQIFFMVSNGPVAWSVLAFNQSLVFHSHAHMTSVFLHFSPIIVSWALRWRQPPNAAFVVCDTDAGCWRHPLGLWWDGTRYFYLPWIVGYYLLVYCPRRLSQAQRVPDALRPRHDLRSERQDLSAALPQVGRRRPTRTARRVHERPPRLRHGHDGPRDNLLVLVLCALGLPGHDLRRVGV